MRDLNSRCLPNGSQIYSLLPSPLGTTSHLPFNAWLRYVFSLHFRTYKRHYPFGEPLAEECRTMDFSVRIVRDTIPTVAFEQLYSPFGSFFIAPTKPTLLKPSASLLRSVPRRTSWGRQDLNLRPTHYECAALTAALLPQVRRAETSCAPLKS